jgi:hypothetical protein
VRGSKGRQEETTGVELSAEMCEVAVGRTKAETDLIMAGRENLACRMVVAAEGQAEGRSGSAVRARQLGGVDELDGGWRDGQDGSDRDAARLERALAHLERECEVLVVLGDELVRERRHAGRARRL